MLDDCERVPSDKAAGALGRGSSKCQRLGCPMTAKVPHPAAQTGPGAALTGVHDKEDLALAGAAATNARRQQACALRLLSRCRAGGDEVPQ